MYTSDHWQKLFTSKFSISAKMKTWLASLHMSSFHSHLFYDYCAINFSLNFLGITFARKFDEAPRCYLIYSWPRYADMKSDNDAPPHCHLNINSHLILWHVEFIQFYFLSKDVNSNVLIQSEAINANASPASDSTRSANVSISTSAKLWTSAVPAPHNASTPQDPTSASARMDLSSRATKASASRLKTNANPWRWRTDMLAVPDRGRMGQ